MKREIKRLIAGMMIGAFASMTISAQDADAMRKQFEEFSKNVKKEYSDFRDKANKEYAEFMRAAWAQFDMEAPVPKPVEKQVPPVFVPENEQEPIEEVPLPVLPEVVPDTPEPVAPVEPEPVAPVEPKKDTVERKKGDKTSPIEVGPVAVDPVLGTPDNKVAPDIKLAGNHNVEHRHGQKDRAIVIDRVIVPEPIPVQPRPVAPIPEYGGKYDKPNYAEFTIYGTPMKVRFAPTQKFHLANNNNDAIADAWVKLATAENNNTIRDCLELRIRHNLSDWAYLQMLDALAQSIYGDSDEAVVFTAFLLTQSGYKTRLARADGNLTVLFGTDATIYDRSYVTFDGTPYYNLHGKAQKLQVCNVAFPGEQAMSMMIAKEPEFDNDPTEVRTIQSRRYSDVKTNVCVNKNLIDFYNNYPSSMVNRDIMTRWANYANTPFAADVKAQIYPDLKRQIEGLGQKAAANRLLNFVQTGFVYEYDDKVWGGDRPFFAEETLYYPYCDCEDRAILFTRLVRDLMGLDAVLVYYPGHLASAIGFTEDVDGDYLTLQGKKYVVCDPTYIGASVGRTMPNMDNQTAQAILLSKD